MSFNEIALRIEANGFKREIAGENDFTAGVEAFKHMVDVAEAQTLGIIVGGEYGIGKTCYIKAVGQMLSNRPYYINLADADDVDKLTDRWMDFWCNNLYERNVILDDIGAEEHRNDYGSIIEPVTEFICNYHTRGTGRIFATTNLCSQELVERYGGRMFSRLKDLCIPVKFNGKDKRKWEI